MFFLTPLVAACAAPAPGTPPLAREQIQWEPIRQWSGHGDQQLDSFPSDTGALRIEWETKSLASVTSPRSLRIVIHSAISGRPLAAAVVDHKGEGAGTAYLSEEPRVFFANVTSQGLDWKIAISERVR